MTFRTLGRGVYECEEMWKRALQPQESHELRGMDKIQSILILVTFHLDKLHVAQSPDLDHFDKSSPQGGTAQGQQHRQLLLAIGATFHACARALDSACV